MSEFLPLSSGRRGSGDFRARIFVLAILLSVLLHAGLAYFTHGSRLNVGTAADGTNSWVRFITQRRPVVAPLPPESQPTETTSADAEGDAVSASFLSTEERLEQQDDATAWSVFEPPPPSATAAETVLPESTAAEASAVETDWQPREQVVEIASRFANDDVLALPRHEVPSLDQLVERPAVVEVGSLATVVARGLEARNFAYTTPAPTHETVHEPASVREANTLQPAPEPTIAVESATQEAATAFLEAPEEVSSASPIDDVLVSSVRTHRPATPDGYLYFEILVARKDQAVLPPIPRDVLFVQDASDSIGEDWLHTCRRALCDMISSNLRPEDRFNVLSFNTETATAFPEPWREATPEAIRAGCRFVDAMTASGKTDLYNAFDKALRTLPVETNRATIVFLLSDGVATAGDLQRDSDLIAHFSTRNNGAASLFGFGITRRPDEYLLSMMSFCNRGGASAVASSRANAAREVTQTFSNICTPVLTDIRFTFDTEAKAIVTPGKITSLYLERPLIFYGRVPEGTKDVTFRAVGQNAGREYDLVFSHPLEPGANGENADLVKKWARTHLYDLFARHSQTPTPQSLDEIKRLARTYDVPSPFRIPTPRAPSHAH